MDNVKDQFDVGDELLKDLFRRSAAQVPPHLKEHIMDQVKGDSEVFEYEPVISKKGWLFIATGFISLVGFLIFYDQPGMTWLLAFDWLDFSFLTEWEFSFSGFIRWFNSWQIEIPFTYRVMIGAFIMVGIHFMVSYRLSGNRYDSQ